MAGTFKFRGRPKLARETIRLDFQPRIFAPHILRGSTLALLLPLPPIPSDSSLTYRTRTPRSYSTFDTRRFRDLLNFRLRGLFRNGVLLDSRQEFIKVLRAGVYSASRRLPALPATDNVEFSG